MSNTILSILYFLDAFFGLVAGLFLGAVIRSRQEEAKEERYFHHPGIEKRLEQTGFDDDNNGKRGNGQGMNRETFRAPRWQKRGKTEDSLLDECDLDPGYTGISCSDLTKNSTEMIEKMRHRQDRKYLFAKREKARKKKTGEKTM